MNLSPHFTLEEMVASRTAAVHRIDNNPPAAIIEQLRRTAQGLELVRALLEVPMTVTSGYRSPVLNAATPGSSSTSQHMTGQACDFIAPQFGTPYQVCKAIMDSGIVFDQLIYEYGAWTHVSFADRNPRRMVLTYDAFGPRPGLQAIR